MRHFTLDEANALLPLLIPVLENLRQLHGQLVRAGEDVAVFEARTRLNGDGRHTPIFSTEHDIQRIQDEIEQRMLYVGGLGVQLKDIEQGVVDFPSRMFGRHVLLCWHLGEDEVCYWHDPDGGFAGRQPL